MSNVKIQITKFTGLQQYAIRRHPDPDVCRRKDLVNANNYY